MELNTVELSGALSRGVALATIQQQAEKISRIELQRRKILQRKII